MNNLGTIIQSLCKDFYKIRQHNEEIDKKERGVGQSFTALRGAAWAVIPGLFVLGLGIGLRYWSSHEKKEKNAIVEHIKVGNYKTAQGLLDNTFTNSEERLGPIVRGVWERGLQSEDTENFFQSQHSGVKGNTRFRVFKGLEEDFSTSLEKIVASNGTEYYTIGDEAGNLYFFNGDQDFRTGVSSKINGRLVPFEHNGERGVLATTLGGLVYKISVETEKTSEHTIKQVPVVKVMYDAHEEMSELRAVDIDDDGKVEYFFVTKSGNLIGITGEGKEVFSQHLLQKGEELDILIPPTIARTTVNGVPEILYYREGSLVAYNPKGTLLRYVNIPGADLANEILVGDIDGDAQPEMVIMTDRKPYVVKLEGQGEEGKPTEGTWLPKELDLRVEKYPDYRWTLVDFTLGTRDLVYGEKIKLKIASAGQKEPFSSPRTFEDGTNYFTSQPLIDDIIGSPEKEVVVGTDEGNLFIINPDSGNLRLKLPAGESKFRGECIKYGTLNNRKYLAFALGNTVYMIGDAWLKRL